jgi:hypothetical protein
LDKLNHNIKRISFRFKDLCTVIQNKNNNIRAFYNNQEIDLNNTLEVNKYKDYYVVDLEIGKENNEPAFIATLSMDSSHIYTPYIDK